MCHIISSLVQNKYVCTCLFAFFDVLNWSLIKTNYMVLKYVQFCVQWGVNHVHRIRVRDMGAIWITYPSKKKSQTVWYYIVPGSALLTVLWVVVTCSAVVGMTQDTSNYWASAMLVNSVFINGYAYLFEWTISSHWPPLTEYVTGVSRTWVWGGISDVLFLLNAIKQRITKWWNQLRETRDIRSLEWLPRAFQSRKLHNVLACTEIQYQSW